jgi:hypothetical protein
VKSVDSDDAASSDFVPSESRVSNKSSKPSLRSAIKAGTENTPEALKIVSSDLLDFNVGFQRDGTLPTRTFLCRPDI